MGQRPTSHQRVVGSNPFHHLASFEHLCVSDHLSFCVCVFEYDVIRHTTVK